MLNVSCELKFYSEQSMSMPSTYHRLALNLPAAKSTQEKDKYVFDLKCRKYRKKFEIFVVFPRKYKMWLRILQLDC